MKKIILLILIMFSLVACKGDLPENGTKWILISLNKKKVNTAKRPFFIINTQKNTISGSGGCNRFSAIYTYKDDILKIDNIISTKMACKDSNIEKDFFKAMKNANKILIDDDILKLFDIDKEIAVFKNVED